VQTFFALRVYELSSNWLLGALVELFVLSQFAFGLAVSVTMNVTLAIQIFVEKYTWLVLAWLALRAAADLIICSTVAFLLRERRTGFKHSDTAVNLMIRWTINTGVVTAITSVVILAVFARAGFHYVVLMLAIPHSGIYMLTMMANLHSRTKIAELWNTPHSIPSNPSCWKMTNLSDPKPRRSKHTGTSPCLTGASDSTAASRNEHIIFIAGE